jgi:hypothetical protein
LKTLEDYAFFRKAETSEKEYRKEFNSYFDETDPHYLTMTSDSEKEEGEG